MTLDKFQSVYREAADELPELKMDAEKARDELHHKRMRRQRYRQLAARGCAAASVILFINVGAVTARNYYESVIKIGGDGFSVESPRNGEDAAKNKLGGAFRSFFLADELSEDGGCAVEEIIESVEYGSVSEFLEKERPVIAMPDLTVMKVDFREEYVAVTGDEVDIILYGEECFFHMRQFEHMDGESYSSATSYGGKSANKRSFTNSQGLNYVLFDTVDDMGRTESSHAVISVNGRDLTIDFQGFEEKIIHDVLNSMDLTVYFRGQ